MAAGTSFGEGVWTGSGADSMISLASLFPVVAGGGVGGAVCFRARGLMLLKATAFAVSIIFFYPSRYRWRSIGGPAGGNKVL